MSLPLQAKLLRFLEERSLRRVGGVEDIHVNVRIIAATNRDLKKEMETGVFREDLYYRLNVFPITMPPLRDRVEDLPLLIDHFIRQIAPSLGVPPARVSDQALAMMMRYEWPGNVRELRNVIERCTLMASDGVIEPEHLPHEIRVDGDAEGAAETGGEGSTGIGRSGSRLADHEKALIVKALNEAEWNQSAAARSLGITRDHLRYRLKKYGLRRAR
jgi:DNA-binding NtrC family response regulator